MIELSIFYLQYFNQSKYTKNQREHSFPKKEKKIPEKKHHENKVFCLVCSKCNALHLQK